MVCDRWRWRAGDWGRLWLARRASTIVLGVAAVWLAGCAVPKELTMLPEATGEKRMVYETERVLTGKASYYYGRWIGRKTANGEIYRAEDVTAAHKTLPFNTMVRVTNLKNGKSVVVRINNRGPYIQGRILDLSLEAAKAIDMTRAGVVPVRAEVLREVEVITKPTENLRPPDWWAGFLESAQAGRE